MYYDSEQNMYHYEPSQYAEPDGQKARPKHLGMKIALVALCCALLGGAAGAGVVGHFTAKQTLADPQRAASETTATIQVSSRPVADVKTVKIDGKKLMTMPEVYASTVNSVVSINTAVTTNVFNQTVESAASGSGFVITADGYVVTNYHVIADAKSVEVTLYSGDTYPAEIIGGDEEYDIAVLKIDAAGLQSVVIGDSASLVVGETIAAIGNPLGELTFSMSQGIVSCANRAINIDGTPFNMIQVDCSVNPGNSGGPLMNSYGEVVGIVSAKYSTYSSTTVEGLGFAIPINDVIAMIQDIMTNGYVTNKPYLGISGGTLTSSMAQQYRYSIKEGVFVYSVESGSAADRAGLKMGDVILAVDDIKIVSMTDLTAAKKNYSAGDTVTLKVYRAGEELTVSLTFDATPAAEEEPEEEQQPQQQPQDGRRRNDEYYYYDPWSFFNDFFGNFYGNLG